MAHEQAIDLVPACVQPHGAVFHDPAFGLEEEQILAVENRFGVAHVFAAARPLVEPGAAVEPAVRGVLILALDPRPQASVQALEARGILLAEAAALPSTQAC